MRSFFTNGPLLAEHIEGSRKYKLSRDLHYKAKSGRTFVVSSGLINNGYSLPFILRGLLQRTSLYPEGAAIHDSAYAGTLCENRGGTIWPIKPTRKESDQLLREVMKRSGASWLLYQSVYYGLRIGGASSYDA